MILIDYQKLDLAAALADAKHPMHAHAVEYDSGIRELREKYPEGVITLKRVGFPKLIDGVTGSGKEVRDIPEPVPPMQISLRAKFAHPKRGKELWAICQGLPKPLQGGLWDIGDKKHVTIEERLNIDLVNEADLAFFMYYRSPQVLKGHLKVDDPKAEVRDKADKKRKALELETAIWQGLADEGALRKMAGWAGVEKADTKEPDTLRFELETILKENDKKATSDPSINRSTKDFLEAMKITDYVRLSHFIRHMMDEGIISYSKDGRFKVADKPIAQLPPSEVKNKFPWLCNYFTSPNQKEALRELFRDTITKDYLDTLTDNKDFRWIASVMDIEGFFNSKPEQVKELVYKNLVLV